MYKLDKKNFLNSISAVFIALMITIFPWEYIRNYEFVDLSRNILAYDYPGYYFNNDFSETSILLILEEPLWYYLNVWFKGLGFSANLFFSLLSIFSLSLIIKYLFDNKVSFVYVLFLINPVFLDFILSQQRNALAFSIFVFLFSFRGWWVKLFFIILPLIHSLAVFIIFSYYLKFLIVKSNNKIFGSKVVVDLLLIAIGFIFSWVLVFGRAYLMGFSDDNRLGEYELEVNSILYILPWMFYLISFVLFSKIININYVLMVLFLSIYIWLTIFEFYAIRFLAMAIPFFIINLSEFKYKIILSILFILHQAILLFYWLKLDG